MSLTIPHPGGTAALTALNAAIATATKPDRVVGQKIAAELSAAIAAWNSHAGVYNAQLAIVGVVSDAVTAANRAASGARVVYPFAEPDISGLGGVDAALARLTAARSQAKGAIADALDEARAELVAAQDPKYSPPSEAEVLALIVAANQFKKYLGAA